MKKFVVVLMLLCFASFAWADQTKTDTQDRLDSAAKTLREIDNAPDKGIPEEVMESAKCVAVVPGLLKGGFIFGGEHGRGVATCKLPNGTWSAPAFFTISGGSWGAQLGVEDVQLVMLAMNNDGMRHLLQDKFQIGAGASASAGPVGRQVSADEGWKLNSQILTYSRAHGLFAGIDLSGSNVEKDADSTRAFYGKNLSTRAILTGKVTPPPAARVFLAAVRKAHAVAVASK